MRTDLLDLAVWREVCTLLAHPERLAEEYRRRLQPETRTKRTPLSTVEGQISKLRQGVARLIDSYAEGLIDKGEFEPRVTRLRQRLARLEEQRQALADEAALHGELQLIIGRLEDCAATLHDGLAATNWTSKRDLIRALVKRVEVARDDVNIVFRIDPYPGDSDPEKKSLQLCRGSAFSAFAQQPMRILGPSSARVNHASDNAMRGPGVRHAPQGSRRKGAPSHHAVLWQPVRHTDDQPSPAPVWGRRVPAQAPSPRHPTCASSGLSPLPRSTRALGRSAGTCPVGPCRTRHARGRARPVETTGSRRARPPRPAPRPSMMRTQVCQAT